MIHIFAAHKRNGDNQAQEPGLERRKKGLVRELAHTNQKKTVMKTPIFTHLKKRFEHIELPAKLLDYFIRSNESNINQNLNLQGFVVSRKCSIMSDKKTLHRQISTCALEL